MPVANLEKKGYIIISSSENKRYKHIILKKKDQFFLKVAKKNPINIKNQISWNNQINNLSSLKLCVPKVIESGKNYALFEHFSKPVGNDLENFIPKIVDLLFWIKGLKIRLPLDNVKNFKHDIGNTKGKILQLAKSYSQGKNFPELLKIIKDTKFRNRALAHCEIKPDHMFDVNGKIGIIDAEWASMKIPEHYDFTSCYARTFIRNPRWAEKLFLQYKKRCEDKDRFMEQFKGLLAWRAIGE